MQNVWKNVGRVGALVDFGDVPLLPSGAIGFAVSLRGNRDSDHPLSQVFHAH